MVGGIATFTNLGSDTPETISLEFNSTGLETAFSNNIVVSPTAAYQLVVYTQPSSSATAGAAFGTQPVIYVEDQYGNVETGDNPTVVTVAHDLATPARSTERPVWRSPLAWRPLRSGRK